MKYLVRRFPQDQLDDLEKYMTALLTLNPDFEGTKIILLSAFTGEHCGFRVMVEPTEYFESLDDPDDLPDYDGEIYLYTIDSDEQYLSIEDLYQQLWGEASIAFRIIDGELCAAPCCHTEEELEHLNAFFYLKEDGHSFEEVEYKSL